jgi:hypothetical protein
MIYELRTYTLRPGTLNDVVTAASTVSRDIRKDNYGKLEGYWQTEIGPLNQVKHLWSYPDLNQRARLRDDLGRNPRWVTEYIPLIRPHLVRQETRLLKAVRAPMAPLGTPNVYELRNYRTKPGAVPQWLQLFTAPWRYARPIRKSSGCGRPSRRRSMRCATYGPIRTSTRAPPCAPRWARIRAGRSSSRPAPGDELHSTVMLPAPHSPLQ